MLVADVERVTTSVTRAPSGMRAPFEPVAPSRTVAVTVWPASSELEQVLSAKATRSVLPDAIVPRRTAGSALPVPLPSRFGVEGRVAPLGRAAGRAGRGSGRGRAGAAVAGAGIGVTFESAAGPSVGETPATGVLSTVVDGVAAASEVSPNVGAAESTRADAFSAARSPPPQAASVSVAVSASSGV